MAMPVPLLSLLQLHFNIRHSSVHPVYSIILLVVIIILSIACAVVAFCCQIFELWEFPLLHTLTQSLNRRHMLSPFYHMHHCRRENGLMHIPPMETSFGHWNTSLLSQAKNPIIGRIFAGNSNIQFFISLPNRYVTSS